MPMNNHAVCIVGVPRSGTSLIAHAARLAGVYLGRDEALIPAVPNVNDDGFFELEELLSLHQSILEAAGQGGWDCSSPLPEYWWRTAAIIPGRQALAQVVMREFSKSPLWGWKSPQGTTLLPLWEELAKELGFSMRLVISFRNPLDVARSLTRVWNLPMPQGLRLWAYYMLTVLDMVKRHPHLFIQYDDFLENPEDGARQLGTFLGCADASLPAQVRAIVRPGLRHSRSSLAELMAVADADIVALYQDCLNRSRGDGGQVKAIPRLIGSLEDYRQWSRLADSRQIDRSPVCLDSAVVFDLGDGRKHVVHKTIPYAPNGAINEEFRLPYSGARMVMFCLYPGNGQYFFRCQIHGIETDGQGQGIEAKNPAREEDGWDVFVPGGKPFYKLAGDFSRATYVRIKGRIEVIGDGPPASFR